MALRRLFVDSIEDDAALVRGDSARHLASAARLRRGERVEISDQVRAYLAVTESCSPAEVRFRIEKALPDPGPVPRLDAALAIIRLPRFEWAVVQVSEATTADAAERRRALHRASQWVVPTRIQDQQPQRRARRRHQQVVDRDRFEAHVDVALQAEHRPGRGS